MSEKKARPVPGLYWFVTANGRPVDITAYGGVRVFVVFSSSEHAKSYQQSLGLPSDWQLRYSNVAEHLIGRCQEVRDNLECEAMLIDPPTDDRTPQGRSFDNMILLIENTATFVEEHGLGGVSWPQA